MKTTSKRAVALYALVVFFVLGLAFFCGSLVTNADNWAMQSINKHLFVGGELENAGTIYDADGTILVESKDGQRVYNGDASIRRATLHLLGDTAGPLSSPLPPPRGKTLQGMLSHPHPFPPPSPRDPPSTIMPARRWEPNTSVAVSTSRTS